MQVVSTTCGKSAGVKLHVSLIFTDSMQRDEGKKLASIRFVAFLAVYTRLKRYFRSLRQCLHKARIQPTTFYTDF